MANAVTGVGSLTSNARTYGGEYMGGGTLRLGRAIEPAIVAGTTATVMGVLTDVPLGRDDATGRLIIGTVNDRAPNVPSGYAANGVATYGSGKRNVVNLILSPVTPSGDTSRGAGDKFTYLVPLAPTNKAYNSLT